MPLHGLRERVRNELVAATVMGIPAPGNAEVLARSPFPALLIDAEHGAFGIGELDAMLRATAIANKPTIVRVPELGHTIANVLDLGAAGVLVPRIDTPEAALEAVSRARYAPEGYRGSGPGRASLDVGMIDYVRQANEHILVAIQIESAEGLANADAIAATPGLDAVVVGPFDLSVSLGTQLGSAELDAAVEKIFAAARNAGIAYGAFAFGPADLKLRVEQGVHLLFTGGDSGYLAAGASAAWDALQSLRGEVGGGGEVGTNSYGV